MSMESMLSNLEKEQGRIFERMSKTEIGTEKHEKLQKAYNFNQRMMLDVEKRISEKELEERKEGLREKELKEKRKDRVANIAIGLGTSAIGVAGTVLAIKSIYTCEQESLMPGNKVNIATKLLKLK